VDFWVEGFGEWMGYVVSYRHVREDQRCLLYVPQFTLQCSGFEVYGLGKSTRYEISHRHSRENWRFLLYVLGFRL